VSSGSSGWFTATLDVIRSPASRSLRRTGPDERRRQTEGSMTNAERAEVEAALLVFAEKTGPTR
jgi:hypothetical protein